MCRPGAERRLRQVSKLRPRGKGGRRGREGGGEREGRRGEGEGGGRGEGGERVEVYLFEGSSVIFTFSSLHLKQALPYPTLLRTKWSHETPSPLYLML